MYYYLADNQLAASFLPNLPLEAAEGGCPSLFLTALAPHGRAAWRVTDPRQLSGPEDVRFLDPRRLPPPPPLPEALEEAARIETLLDELPAVQAEAIRLHVYSSLRFTEIAEVLDCPATTVRSRFAAGIGNLKKKLNL